MTACSSSDSSVTGSPVSVVTERKRCLTDALAAASMLSRILPWSTRKVTTMRTCRAVSALVVPPPAACPASPTGVRVRTRKGRRARAGSKHGRARCRGKGRRRGRDGERAKGAWAWGQGVGRTCTRPRCTARGEPRDLLRVGLDELADLAHVVAAHLEELVQRACAERNTRAWRKTRARSRVG